MTVCLWFGPSSVPYWGILRKHYSHRSQKRRNDRCCIFMTDWLDWREYSKWASRCRLIATAPYMISLGKRSLESTYDDARWKNTCAGERYPTELGRKEMERKRWRSKALYRCYLWRPIKYWSRSRGVGWVINLFHSVHRLVFLSPWMRPVF